MLIPEALRAEAVADAAGQRRLRGPMIALAKAFADPLD